MNIFMLPNFQWIFEEMYRPAVQKGVAWLDEKYPDWVTKIVGETLDLSSTDYCICGQMFGDYAYRPNFVHGAQDFGFNTREDVEEMFQNTLDGSTIMLMSYQTLDVLWQDEIFWRCQPDLV